MQEHTEPFSNRVNALTFYSSLLSIIILVNINLNALITRQFLNNYDGLHSMSFGKDLSPLGPGNEVGITLSLTECHVTKY